MALSAKGLTHRPTVTGRRGLVSSANPHASVAGLRVLMDGGNAIDAAVATAAALNVAEPYMSGIGGIGYMHIYHAASGDHKILDYVGLTPKAAQLDLYKSPASKQRGPLSVLTPGACGGWLEALRRYGTMDAATVFAPAIELAEQGFAVTVNNAAIFDGTADEFRKYPSSATTYLNDNRPPRPGDVLVQQDLGETFRAVAEAGPSVFYTGEIGEIIAAFMAETGGVLSKEDLTGFEPVWLDPISVDYRGYTVYVPAPPCQGIQILTTLNILEGFDVAELGHNTTEGLHRFLEAAKLSIADRIAYAGGQSQTAGLLSKEYAAQRRALIGDRAQPSGGDTYTEQKLENEVTPGDPHGFMKTECTTHFDVIDADGNAVAVTQSLGSGFGSAMVVPGTGIALNNFMNWFDLEPNSPNAIGPSKKNEMCVSPVQVWDEAGLRFLIGTPGSHGILQTTPQMIMNIIDHGLNIQAAIEAPRVKTGTGCTIVAEDRIDGDVLAGLETKGHRVDLLGDWSMGVGGGQGIIVDPESGAFSGGADPRRDGYSLGW